MNVHLFLLIILLSSNFTKTTLAAEVTIIKYWYLPHREITFDVFAAKKKYKQFKNHNLVYNYAKDLIEDEDSSIVISEGCEGVIDSSFKRSYHGWTYKLLAKNLKQRFYDDIITLIPLKLKVQFRDKVVVLCGDSYALRKKEHKSRQNLVAQLHLYQNILRYKDDKKKYKIYRTHLLDQVPKTKNMNRLEILEEARKETLNKLQEYQLVEKRRNLRFLNQILTHYKKNPIVIRDGTHVKSLTKLLDTNNIEYNVVTLDYHPTDKDEKVDALKRQLHRAKARREKAGI